METYEDKDRHTLGSSKAAAPIQLMTPQGDEDGTGYLTSHATH